MILPRTVHVTSENGHASPGDSHTVLQGVILTYLDSPSQHALVPSRSIPWPVRYKYAIRHKLSPSGTLFGGVFVVRTSNRKPLSQLLDCTSTPVSKLYCYWVIKSPTISRCLQRLIYEKNSVHTSDLFCHAHARTHARIHTGDNPKHKHKPQFIHPLLLLEQSFEFFTRLLARPAKQHSNECKAGGCLVPTTLQRFRRDLSFQASNRHKGHNGNNSHRRVGINKPTEACNTSHLRLPATKPHKLKEKQRLRTYQKQFFLCRNLVAKAPCSASTRRFAPNASLNLFRTHH